VELINITHFSAQPEPGFEPDLFITGSGYESRATCIPKKLNDPGHKKVVLAFTDHMKEQVRNENDRFFRAHGYEFILIKPFGQPDFATVFKGLDQDRIQILLDITMMPRRCYHGFLHFLHQNDHYKHAEVRISYCPALFYEPVSMRRKIQLTNFALNGEKRTKRKNTKKTAMIMGLGNDNGVGQAVANMVQPDHMLLLYADPAVHKSYVENIFVFNHSLITNVDIQNLIAYPLRDTAAVYKTLVDLSLPLRNEYNVMIVPQGPKIFSLLSMVLHLNYPDVNVVYPEYKVRERKDKKSYADHISIDLEFAAD
jgi:hypothetical protein